MIKYNSFFSRFLPMRVVKQQTAIAASSKYEFSDMLRLRSGVE